MVVVVLVVVVTLVAVAVARKWQSRDDAAEGKVAADGDGERSKEAPWSRWWSRW